MENITLHAHYDGSKLLLDEPYELQPDTRLLITVIPPDTADNSAWEHFSRQGLAAAYSPAEPEYALSMVKESNPSYERG